MSLRIVVQKVSKQYGAHQVQALRGVSLEVTPGEFVALMGPSGCGKSTLLNILGAIDQPTAGKVFFGEQETSHLTEEALTQIRREQLGYIFQFFNLLSTLTVAENVALPLELNHRLSDTETQQRVQSMLEQVGLAHRADFYPSQLSGGEMQRVAIARALVHQPGVILADEPTGNLDTENGAQVLQLIRALCRENGQTVIMATHSQEAAQYADRILRMRDGQLVEAS